jgi:predicted nucleic acid-binding protein
MERQGMRILIDSSCWIDFLREGAEKHQRICNAIRNRTAMLCPVVWVELSSGLRGKRERQALANIKDSCGWLDIDHQTWNIAAELRGMARQKGLNCPLADVLVVACAKRHGAEVMHRDKHFDALMKLALS